MGSQNMAWGPHSGSKLVLVPFEGRAEPEKEKQISPENKQPQSWTLIATLDLLAAARLCGARQLG